MKAKGLKTSWWVAAAGATAVLAASVALFRAPATPLASSPASRAAVVMLLQVGGGDPGLADEASLFDPTPLFLPTRWNASQKDVPRREPAGVLERFPERLRFADSGLALAVFEPASDDGLRQTAFATLAPEISLAGFSRTDIPVRPVSERGAFVEVFAAGSGLRIFAQAQNPEEARPPGEGNWMPLECVLSVGSAGLVGAISVTQRSGVEAVDQYFQVYLMQKLKLGARLPPGFYRVWIGP